MVMICMDTIMNIMLLVERSLLFSPNQPRRYYEHNAFSREIIRYLHPINHEGHIRAAMLRFNNIMILYKQSVRVVDASCLGETFNLAFPPDTNYTIVCHIV